MNNCPDDVILLSSHLFGVKSLLDDNWPDDIFFAKCRHVAATCQLSRVSASA